MSVAYILYSKCVRVYVYEVTACPCGALALVEWSGLQSVCSNENAMMYSSGWLFNTSLPSLSKWARVTTQWSKPRRPIKHFPEMHFLCCHRFCEMIRMKSNCTTLPSQCYNCHSKTMQVDSLLSTTTIKSLLEGDMKWTHFPHSYNISNKETLICFLCLQLLHIYRLVHRWDFASEVRFMLKKT